MSGFRATPGFTEDWGYFDFTIVDQVGTITFDRPEKLNALTFDVYADLRDLLREVPHRDDVDVLVITGRGKGFCSGGDVEEIIGRLVEFDARTLLAFTKEKTPEKIEGDLMRLFPEERWTLLAHLLIFHGRQVCIASVGLSGGDMGSAYLLPRRVGVGRATEILMFGDPVDADTAHAIGLATAVVTGDELQPAIDALARRLADGPTFAYSATKLLLTRAQDMDLAGALELEAMTQALLMTSEDHAEFYEAFSGKRAPRWTGR